jgi:hypothetical protein
VLGEAGGKVGGWGKSLAWNFWWRLRPGYRLLYPCVGAGAGARRLVTLTLGRQVGKKGPRRESRRGRRRQYLEPHPVAVRRPPWPCLPLCVCRAPCLCDGHCARPRFRKSRAIVGPQEAGTSRVPPDIRPSRRSLTLRHLLSGPTTIPATSNAFSRRRKLVAFHLRSDIDCHFRLRYGPQVHSTMASSLQHMAAGITERSKTLINNDLKKICKEEGTSQTGNKAALQARVVGRRCSRMRFSFTSRAQLLPFIAVC